jgi:hypothetical protein
MTWLGVLAVVVALIAAFSFVGARPRGGRPVEGTQLMMVGRVVLVLTALAIAWAAFGR